MTKQHEEIQNILGDAGINVTNEQVIAIENVIKIVAQRELNTLESEKLKRQHELDMMLIHRRQRENMTDLNRELVRIKVGGKFTGGNNIDTESYKLK